MKRILVKPNENIFFSTEHVDMRKSINGLAAIVENDFELDLYEDALFVFINRARDKVKILHWDKDGFVLYYKRREKGRFAWPDNFREGKVNEVTAYDLERFLKGLVMEAYVPRRSFVSS
ncbi:MAG: IS66 family insertion sequence element accessory protein TnpB [Bacillota bacterium]|nr:IS66 family insertion sequence element accessory protein TnpB [Bacillota bacterium]